MSLLGALLRPQSFRGSSKKIKAAPLMIQEAAQQKRRQASRCIQGNNKKTAARLRKGIDPRIVEDVFIESLVAASTSIRCRQKVTHSSITRKSCTNNHQRYDYITPYTSRRHFSHGYRSSQKAVAFAPFEELESSDQSEASEEHHPPIPREQYRALVNTYDSPSDLWEQPKGGPLAPAEPRREHYPLAPRLVLTPEQESRPPYAQRHILPPEDPYHAKQLEEFRKQLETPGQGRSSSHVWHAYQKLRSPRPRYIGDGEIRVLFKHLARVEFKDTVTSQRYFSVLDECVAEHVPITLAEWTTATAFAARWVRHTTTEEVRQAVKSWMRMENAGSPADHVTFNILFDVAIRAGRFALADTIHNELKARGLWLDRSFRTSMIYYAGRRRNGDAVRQAFRDFVNAGEIVDTSVMNCVILSLLRAGEVASAEHVFSKMKHLHETKFGPEGPKDWRGRRHVHKILRRTANALRKDKEEHEASFFGGLFSSDARREEAQKLAPIHPDWRTCQILIKYHARVSGNLDRVRQLLEETRELKDGFVHGSTYAYIFRGFSIFGGPSYMAWNGKSLQAFWDEFLEAVELDESALVQEEDGLEISNEDRPPYFTPKLAISVLAAFYECKGRKKMLEVWELIQDRWKNMSGEERLKIEWRVQKFVREDDRYVV